MTATDAAARWGITPSAVLKLIRRGRIRDTRLEIIEGRATWTFPDQPKPSKLKRGGPHRTGNESNGLQGNIPDNTQGGRP